jgi:hypothetical protein
MPAKAGIQYAMTPKFEPRRRGVLDHPLSRMMTSVQDAASAHHGARGNALVRARVLVAKAKGVKKNA